MKPVIQVEGISKQFRLGTRREQYRTLRESIAGGVRGAWGKVRGGSRANDDGDFWALKDVSFDVQPGEVVGIIGRNGSGKSTLLKILSQIYEPTSGRAVLRGRLASLLEVGTGFHPELTGRENIYLNGSILGMSRREITRKFDEIVAFSEIEQFLDTPVKRYSSGMYVRLAFAVAAHLEPEILIVDEVLAVGDAAFQRKCLSAMERVGSGGRTVIFVSHNMAAVSRICKRVLLINKGDLVGDGPSEKLVGQYLRSDSGTTARQVWTDMSQSPGNDIVRMQSVRIVNQDSIEQESADIRKPIGIEICYNIHVSGHVIVPNFHLFNSEGDCVFVAIDTDETWHRRSKSTGSYTTTAWIPGNYLAEGLHFIRVSLTTFAPMKVHADASDVVAFHVVDTMDGDSARGDYAGPLPGIVRPNLRWNTIVG